MDAVEEIKSRLNIEDVIGEYIQLKRAGRNFKGLSPFTNEKTPSFMVSPEKQIWHDFSSGKGGNVFSFIMEMEGLDFKGALEHLARKASVDLSQYRSGSGAATGRLKERLFEVLELATKFYQAQLKGSEKALEYVFKQRRFNKDVVLAFRLGYAPNTGFALTDYLKKKGVTDRELQQAGLSSRYRSRTSDMFRERLMVPLMDPQGKVVGFTARLLADEPNAPKYINTPQTLLYDKGRHIYGLYLAKEAIRQNGYVVVAEGNLDVISSHQAGINQIVATAGTAMTEMHLKTLSRFTNDVRLAFDQDRAGQAAAERAIPLAGKTGVSLSMVTTGKAKDPDELIKQDPKLWQAAIERSLYTMDWLIERYRQQLDLTSAAGKRQFSDVTLAVISKLPDRVEQEHYMQKIAEVLSVSKEALKSKLAGKQYSSPLRKGRAVSVQADTVTTDRLKTQNHLLALALMQPNLRSFLENIADSMLVHEAGRTLLNFLHCDPDFPSQTQEVVSLLKQNGQSNQEPVGQMQSLEDYVKMLSLQYEATYQGIDDLELEYEAKRLQGHLIEQYVKHEKAALAAKMRETEDDSQLQTLLEEAKSLDMLLKTRKDENND